MRLEEPAWWYRRRGSLPEVLMRPAAAIWGRVAQRRFERVTAYRSSRPVVCIGNFTVGGTGKTPLALHVAADLARLGRKPAFLTRGYGGRVSGPRWVDAERDSADEVGDEALLLAQQAPTLVARNRAAGARAIEGRGPGCDIIIMDDGLQNPSLAKDLVVAVVDGLRGIGNGRVMPAGPLRAPLEFQLGLADAVVVNAHPVPSSISPSETAEWLRQRFPGPVLDAAIAPSAPADWLDRAAVVAFAGIGVPQRFFDLLGRLGADVRAVVPFPDHHPFDAADAARLLGLAEMHGALLVTTQKDWVRLGAATTPLRAAARPLPVSLGFAERDQARLDALLETALKAHAERGPD